MEKRTESAVANGIIKAVLAISLFVGMILFNVWQWSIPSEEEVRHRKALERADFAMRAQTVINDLDRIAGSRR